MLTFLVRHRRRVIGCVIAGLFTSWLLRLSILHWWETESGDSFFTFASLSVIAELMVVALGSILQKATKSGVLAGMAVIAAAVVFEGCALYQPMRGLAEKLVPPPAVAIDGTAARAEAQVLREQGREIDQALASGDAGRLQVAIGAIDPALLTSEVADARLGPATRRAAAQAKGMVGQRLASLDAQAIAGSEQRTAQARWELLPVGLVGLSLAVSLMLGHVAFGPEAGAKKLRDASQEPQSVRYTAQDFALGRVPVRPGFRRVGVGPSPRFPRGYVRFQPGAEDDAKYLASVARMRHELGLDKPQLRVVK